MDTNSRALTDAGDRSGGKILRHRQKFALKKPYIRPSPPPQDGETGSGINWFRGLGLPGASRMIFSGASKLLSFMTDADDSPSSSSSGSEDDGSCDDIGDANMPTKIGNLKEKDETTSEMIESFRKESQLSLLKSDPKRVIEQLIAQVTFSREECDNLIEIIKSRVVDCSATEGQITGIFETPSRIFGSDAQDLCSKALLEAKNWLDEKKVGSSAKPNLDHGVSGFSSIELRQLTKHDVGSPVDLAKSYMLDRPPWASLSLRRSGSKTPSPMAIDLFKDKTPFSAGGNSLPYSQKKDTFASGSWNIQDEIRRVRSKETEDLLCTLPSTRIDLSSYALEPKTLGHFSVADKIDDNVDRMHVSHSLTPTQLVDASVNLAAGLNTHQDFPGSSALGLAKNNLEIELLSSNQPTISCEPSQVPESNLKFEGGRVITDSHHIIIGQELLSVQHDAYDESGQRNISTKEVDKVSGPTNANGSASPRSTSLSTDPNIEHPKQSDENNLHPVISINDKLTSSIPGEEMCGFLSETLVEIPLENEVNITVSGLQDSSSSTLVKNSTQVDLKRGCVIRNTENGDEKQPDKKATKFQRKGRGRGKRL